VSVGRLDAMKNLALIVKAFALVDAPDWEVRIFGAGTERQNLENLIDTLGLKNRVFLKGLSKNIYSELEKASIFAFGSKMEGYPNALLEGLSAGLATVSSDCPYGPSEIITDGKNGLLVPNNDEKAFAAALQRLINDVNLRAKLGDEAAKIADELSIEKIMKEWEAVVLKKVTHLKVALRSK
jgi:GalNAc-alpha-(1->4)-GalNAc-alpha-(1->3)-diNAcBac-PP-undecaprenol alpha-1,4-N-acetyl-D-galactosaminyltransferase